MFERRLPVGRIAALVAIAFGVWVVAQDGTRVRWRTVEPGLEFATMRGDPYCRRGSAQVAVLRMDPARVRIAVRHYSREPERQPLDVLGWRKRARALAVFNAGQYYPDWSYMGLLVSGGTPVSRRVHPAFKAALVADPVRGRPAARVLDLEDEPLDPASPGWGEVAQSFMLFDREGNLRVRASDRVANRTAVAEGRDGHLYAFTTEGGYTLRDFATWLRGSRLGLTHAMSMDGGAEAQLCVAGGGFRYATFGDWDGGDDADAAGAQVPLPAVVVVTRRANAK